MESGPDRTRSATSFEGVVVPIAALERAPLFEGLDPGELAAVAARMRFRDFEAGTVICREGERGDSMFVIVEGLVHVIVATPVPPAERSRSVFAEGRIVAKMRRGEVIGATALVTGEPRSATVVAHIPTSALELGEEDFRALIAELPAILTNLTRILSVQLAEAHARHMRGGRRGEAVALVVAPALASAAAAVLSATEAASARPVASLDARSSLEEALSRLDDLLKDHGTVVVVADLEQEDLPPLLEQVDRAVALVAKEHDAARLVALGGKSAVGGEHAELVMPREGLRSAARTGRREVAGIPVTRLFAGDGDGGLPEREVAWLGRHLSRTKLGLALGAGGAKGYAHVGALQALERAGYAIDYVAGSSIGAIVGCYLALGMGADEIDATLRETFDPETVAAAFTLSLSGESTGLELITRIFRETTDERTFADTQIPLVMMAVDLTDREPAPLREGPLWKALLAATALAGMFPPYEQNGHRLVDGLALVPVPTGSLIEEGADITLSVNLMSRETLPAWPGEAPATPEPPKRRGSRMLDTLLEVMDLAQLDTSVRHAQLADVVVTPRFGPSSWRDFHLADQFLAAGREATEERLPALQALARPQFAGITT